MSEGTQKDPPVQLSPRALLKLDSEWRQLPRDDLQLFLGYEVHKNLRFKTVVTASRPAISPSPFNSY